VYHKIRSNINNKILSTKYKNDFSYYRLVLLTKYYVVARILSSKTVFALGFITVRVNKRLRNVKKYLLKFEILLEKPSFNFGYILIFRYKYLNEYILYE